MNSQTERTRLAWRRTILAMLVAVLLGALHVALAGRGLPAALIGVIGAVGCLPALSRSAILRQPGEPPPATWQPLAVTVAACAVAVVAIVGS